MVHAPIKKISLYSPNPAPSDDHLFWSLKNSLTSISFALMEGYESYFSSFFCAQTVKFYKRYKKNARRLSIEIAHI